MREHEQRCRHSPLTGKTACRESEAGTVAQATGSLNPREGGGVWKAGPLRLGAAPTGKTSGQSTV